MGCMDKFVENMFLPKEPATEPGRDPWGRRYPPQCTPEALAAVKIPIVRVSQSFLDKATKSKNRYGVYLPTGAMAVRNDLTGAMLQGVIDHEACHYIMKQLTGSPEWHK